MSDKSYPVELAAPDISPYKAGNTGIDYVTTFDGGRPGPHVMVNAITHGNELCGPIALEFLFKNGVRPTRGKLTLSFANHEA
ncbi:MAG: succinylglutamate desuccinylase, partial [Alphaproteobacteria bacterium]